MFNDRRWIPVVFLLLAAALSGCGGREKGGAEGEKQGERDDPARLRLEYSVLKSELELAKNDSLYLVIDMPAGLFVIKQRGAVLWEHPVEVVGGESGRRKFVDSFTGKNRLYVRKVQDTHLYAFTEQSPDSVLKIVSETVRTTIERMQRVVPERFDITWGDGLILEIVTEIKGRPESRFSNLITSIRRSFQRQGRGAKLVVRMDAKRSVTFYRVAVRGLPTLIIPG